MDYSKIVKEATGNSLSQMPEIIRNVAELESSRMSRNALDNYCIRDAEEEINFFKKRIEKFENNNEKFNVTQDKKIALQKFKLAKLESAVYGDSPTHQQMRKGENGIANEKRMKRLCQHVDTDDLRHNNSLTNSEKHDLAKFNRLQESLNRKGNEKRRTININKRRDNSNHWHNEAVFEEKSFIDEIESEAVVTGSSEHFVAGFEK